MRKELLWDQDKSKASKETILERLINFGGFKEIEIAQKKWGMDFFRDVLQNNKNLNLKALNYWCFILKMKRKDMAAFKFKKHQIWRPFR